MSERITLRDMVGREIQLSFPYRLSAHSGLGPPAPRLVAQRNAYRSGQLTVFTAWEARVLQLTLELTPPPFHYLHTYRDALNRMLASLYQGVRVGIRREDGTEFEGAFRLASEVPQAREAERGGMAQRIVLTLVSDEPWWHGVSQTWVFAVSAGAGAWGFPLGFPQGFGASTIDSVESQRYAGQVDAFPIISVRGPGRKLVIENVTLGTVLSLPTYILASGETVTFDLREDRKTIATSLSSASLLPHLSEDSHLGTWRLGAHPNPIDGDNSIRIYMEDVTHLTTISLIFHPRYIGI